MSKPTNKPGWNPTTNSTEPSSAKKAAGWSSGEKPSSAHFNWLMKTVSEWIDHIDAEGVQGPKGDTGPQGPQGEKGDTGPAGASGGISSADLARISALEGVSGIVAASPVTVTFPYNGGAAPSEYSIGDSGSSIDVNWANGASQFVTLTADATVSFTGGTAGNTYYLRIQQGGYGLKRVVGWPTNIVWNSGSVPTISTAAWTVDVIGCYCDGTNYYGYVSQGHFTAPSVIDTKNGYIAGGWTGGSSGSYVSNLEKMNLNSDTTLSIVQAQLGYVQNSSGTLVYPFNRVGGSGTQSSTHGYKTYDSYSSLVSVNGQTSSVTSKIPFSNDTQVIIIRLPLTMEFANGGQGGFGSGRGGIVQSSIKAYKTSYASGVVNKMESLTFSTDSVSVYSTLNNLLRGTNMGNAGLSNWYSFAYSTSLGGAIWQAEQLQSAGQTLSAVKFLFSNETNLTASSFNSFQTNTNSWGEAVDGDYNAYIQRTTSATGSGTSQLEKTDKSVDAWTVVAQSAGAVTSAAATQGKTAGYFCGGANITSFGLSLYPSAYPNSTSVSTIKKVAYSPETYSTHSISLNSARLFAAGFEG